MQHGYAYNISVTVLSYFCRGYGTSQEIKYIQEGMCDEVGEMGNNGNVYINLIKKIPLPDKNIINRIKTVTNEKNIECFQPDIIHIIVLRYTDIDGNEIKKYLRQNNSVDILGVLTYKELEEEKFNNFKNKFFKDTKIYKILSFKQFEEEKFLKYLHVDNTSFNDFNERTFDN